MSSEQPVLDPSCMQRLKTRHLQFTLISHQSSTETLSFVTISIFHHIYWYTYDPLPYNEHVPNSFIYHCIQMANKVKFVRQKNTKRLSLTANFKPIFANIVTGLHSIWIDQMKDTTFR